MIFLQNFSTNFWTRTPSVFNANLTIFRKISDNVNFDVEGHEIAQMKGIGELNSYIQLIIVSNNLTCCSIPKKGVIFYAKSCYFVDMEGISLNLLKSVKKYYGFCWTCIQGGT